MDTYFNKVGMNEYQEKTGEIKEQDFAEQHPDIYEVVCDLRTRFVKVMFPKDKREEEES